jgi:hypothetical protein
MRNPKKGKKLAQPKATPQPSGAAAAMAVDGDAEPSGPPAVRRHAQTVTLQQLVFLTHASYQNPPCFPSPGATLTHVAPALLHATH